jgi:hypothetical protein
MKVDEYQQFVIFTKKINASAIWKLDSIAIFFIFYSKFKFVSPFRFALYKQGWAVGDDWYLFNGTNR